MNALHYIQDHLLFQPEIRGEPRLWSSVLALILVSLLLVNLIGCATNYPGPYRFTGAPREQRNCNKPAVSGNHQASITHQPAFDEPARFSTNNEPALQSGVHDETSEETAYPFKGSTPSGQGVDQAQVGDGQTFESQVQFPKGVETLRDASPFTHPPPGLIGHILAAVIQILLPNRYLRSILMLAIPYIEDAILDFVVWLFDEPKPQPLVEDPELSGLDPEHIGNRCLKVGLTVYLSGSHGPATVY